MVYRWYIFMLTVVYKWVIIPLPIDISPTKEGNSPIHVGPPSTRNSPRNSVEVATLHQVQRHLPVLPKRREDGFSVGFSIWKSPWCHQPRIFNIILQQLYHLYHEHIIWHDIYIYMIYIYIYDIYIYDTHIYIYMILIYIYMSISSWWSISSCSHEESVWSSSVSVGYPQMTSVSR